MQPYDLFKLQLNLTTLMMETQTVMALRVMGMSGVIPAHRGENDRMVSEKGPAMAKAFHAATKAAFAGARPDQVLSAAMVPVSKRVSANRKRLSK
ncbi:Antifreeze protein, type I [Sulfitobacter noctilucae]|uniref:hypothetical protein n=1 Tax=Sulfitobacter noctilucae TaxID=1342302 RepID=UPI000469D502|nr:hypothetical protein [Sulfitobacter noctilucae]KIN75020.1 Antifreeze protein, type I [Sulfitobacter noctilucae]